MNLKQAMLERHSVRAFLNKPIDEESAKVLSEEIDKVNSQQGLHFQLCLNEPEAFAAEQPSYGSFKNCRNYIAVVADASRKEACGYWGQHLILTAQAMGINSCWVALTYKKNKATYVCNGNEKLLVVIALGYGQTLGVQHKSKSAEQVSKSKGIAPQWFTNGVEAALLAPTAVNQQKFLFTLKTDGTVEAKSLFSIIGHTEMDLGIAKYQFELGAGKENFSWDKQ